MVHPNLGPKTSTVAKTQFKAHALALFRQIEATGEPIVITDHGTPALEVRPYRPGPANRSDPLEHLRGTVLHYDDPFAPVADGAWEALR